MPTGTGVLGWRMVVDVAVPQEAAMVTGIKMYFAKYKVIK